MSKVIHVLEQMSRDANCQSEDAINNLLETAELDTKITEAIINKDVSSLECQLDVCPDIICIVMTPDDDEDEEKDDEDSSEEKSINVIGF
ncbi:hypothetical protein L3081_04910 [Colwellia sp. MSW7]|uniref:Uncharacterized protein n=1 Tax=Colwellia maritima TaxID=2912588 RepID=A0ABS9WY26_9GAMM|nr:hypothetical protein [Colwellia maritima]MCI2282863.1 hypothetical protein [Colwellia maritima]